MSNDTLAPATLRTDAGGALSERGRFVAFVLDADSEAALRESLGGLLPGTLDIRRMSCRQAIAQLRKMQTPQVIIVDISGEDQPISALVDLAEVVEPDARVLVIGEREDVNFYRQVTRGLGVLEYLYKPLARNMISRHFGPLVSNDASTTEDIKGGRLITITGAAGGVGATTLATNLAWHFATDIRRHTLLLDPDLYTGTAALMLGAKSGAGLKTMLEVPDRLDELFVERSTFAITDRLSVLSGEEKLAVDVTVAPAAVRSLIATLLRRYNFVIGDVPFRAAELNRDLLSSAHQSIIVLDPTLRSIRGAIRLQLLPLNASQSRRPIIVLNGLGQPGALSRAQIEEALGRPPDIVIPYQPRLVNQANTVGKPAAASRGAFRDGIIRLSQEAASVRFTEADPHGRDQKRSGLLTRILPWRR